MAIFTGLLSPTRYFIESLAIQESRCLPVCTIVEIYRRCGALTAEAPASHHFVYGSWLSLLLWRHLQVQSGFTSFGPNFRGEALQAASFQLLHLGLNDFKEVTTQSFYGWYWGALPGKGIKFTACKDKRREFFVDTLICLHLSGLFCETQELIRCFCLALIAQRWLLEYGCDGWPSEQSTHVTGRSKPRGHTVRSWQRTRVR